MSTAFVTLLRIVLNKCFASCTFSEVEEAELEETGAEDMPVVEAVTPHLAYGHAYKCSVCDRDFAKSSHLKQHMLSHSGITVDVLLRVVCV